MNRDIVTRTIVETVVDRCIREVEEDPRRSIRKLVDMGRQLAKGRFQQQFFELTQRMLSDEESPYYTMLRNLVKKVDHDTIKTFGINMGLGSWTCGARTIRELEARLGYNIPWAITLHVDSSLDQAGQRLYRRVISEGKADGVFAYLLRVEGSGVELEGVLDLARGEPSCAFILFMGPDDLTRERVGRLYACHNLVPVVSTDQPGWEAAARQLEAARCMYGVYRFYSGEDSAREITMGTWMKRVAGCCCPTLAFSFAEPGCSPEVCRRMAAYVRRARTEQYYSVFLIDYFSDHLYIDEIISGGHCFMGVRPDGTVTECVDGTERDTGRSLAGMSLEEVLGDSALSSRGFR